MITIERYKDYEHRLGVQIQKISIKPSEDGWFDVYCELHAINGGEIDCSIDVQCVAYGKDGSILSMISDFISDDEFFGFEVLEFAFQVDGMYNNVETIKVFPKK